MAREIDLLKKKNRIEKYTSLYYLHYPSNVAYMAAIGFGATTALISNNAITAAFCGAITLESAFLLHRRCKQLKEYDSTLVGNILYDHIVRTEEYEELKKLYEEYIKKVAELLRTFSFESPKELLLFIEVMLQSGILSSTLENKYHEYKNNFEYVTDVIGANVLTGYSVCRHMTTLFNDILSEYGQTSAFIVVRTAMNKDVISALEVENPKFEHAVVGIGVGSEKYLFDPTIGEFVGAAMEKVPEGYESFIGKIIDMKGKKAPYYVLANKQICFTQEKLQSTLRIASLPFTPISMSEINYYEQKAIEKFENNSSMIHGFCGENFDMVRRIAYLSSVVNPVSDSEITEWKLTKRKF